MRFRLSRSSIGFFGLIPLMDGCSGCSAVVFSTFLVFVGWCSRSCAFAGLGLVVQMLSLAILNAALMDVQGVFIYVSVPSWVTVTG